MKTKLLLLLFLPSIMFAQVGNGFENLTGTTFDGGACRYFDSNTTTAHTLVNYVAGCGTIYVTEPSSAGVLGYSITYNPNGNGSTGFSDGDAFGVASAAHLTNDFAPAPEGNQAFYMEDPDGSATMSFDLVDLAGTTSPQLSMKYQLEATSWETADFLKISIQFSDCASSALVLLDTTTGTGDIDDLNIEDVWLTLNADLTANVGCKAQLVVEFSSNSAAEELGLDDITFSAGMTLSTETVNLVRDISLYPNPSNGVINIKNNGIALESVRVTDINGRTIETMNLHGATSNITLDMQSDLSSGMYFVSILSERGSIIKKLIIK